MKQWHVINLHDLKFAFNFIIITVVAKLLLEILNLGCLRDSIINRYMHGK